MIRHIKYKKNEVRDRILIRDVGNIKHLDLGHEPERMRIWLGHEPELMRIWLNAWYHLIDGWPFWYRFGKITSSRSIIRAK